jgi:hypothetical protein
LNYKNAFMNGLKKEGQGYLQTIESEGIVGTESHVDKSFRLARKVEISNLSSVDKKSVVSHGDLEDLNLKIGAHKSSGNG